MDRPIKPALVMPLLAPVRRAAHSSQEIIVKTIDFGALPALLRAKEAIRVSGLSKDTVYDRAKKGLVICRKQGRTTYIETASLLPYIASMPRLGEV